VFVGVVLALALSGVGLFFVIRIQCRPWASSCVFVVVCVRGCSFVRSGIHWYVGLPPPLLFILSWSHCWQVGSQMGWW
jgi:hypothetical protein